MFSLLAEYLIFVQEEVWEVAAQLIGLGLGILIIVCYLFISSPHWISLKSLYLCHVERLYTIILMQDTPGLVKSFPFVSLTWTSIRIVHLWLRYQSLAVLQFNTVRALKWIFL